MTKVTGHFYSPTFRSCLDEIIDPHTLSVILVGSPSLKGEKS